MRTSAFKGSMCLIVLLGAVRCTMTSRAAQSPASPATPTQSQVIFLPGIAGVRDIERSVPGELRDGGIAGQITLFDWTAGREGLNALCDYSRNRSAAKQLSRQLTDAMASNPGRQVTLIAHSGGAGIAVWALEDMPAHTGVHDVILLAPGLSPGYDLSRALTHVRGQMVVFYSSRDWWVSGAGTKLLGTVDRVNTESAGYLGFHMPPAANADQYARLLQMPYDPAWAALGNTGDHMGPLMPRFVRAVIAPLLQDKPSNADGQRKQ